LPWNRDWLVNPLVGTNDRMTQVDDLRSADVSRCHSWGSRRAGTPSGQRQCH
jgi:hypothetical protein